MVQATIRLAQYQDGFKQYLSAFSRHSALLTQWLQGLPEARPLAINVAADGRKLLADVVTDSQSIMEASQRPLAVLRDQLSLTQGCLDAVLTATTEGAAKASQGLMDCLFTLGNIVKAMMALNILVQRGSVRPRCRGDADDQDVRQIVRLLRVGHAGWSQIFQATKLAANTELDNLPRRLYRLMVIGDQGRRPCGRSRMENVRINQNKTFHAFGIVSVGVGKTTLVRRFCSDAVDRVTPTHGYEIHMIRNLMIRTN